MNASPGMWILYGSPSSPTVGHLLGVLPATSGDQAAEALTSAPAAAGFVMLACLLVFVRVCLRYLRQVGRSAGA